MDKLIDRWESIDWASVQSKVLKWQQDVYFETKSGNMKKVRFLQHKIVDSFEAKLLATKRVTQDNSGKVTAGIDGMKRLPPNKRLIMAQSLKIPTKGQPLRRVWIPKPGSDEKRPLGIPIMSDRCLQALVKLAIEPEWEAKFEANSYGFRPGRNCHDAVKAVLDSTIKGSKYVLDADISKCFDRINHDALLDKTGLKGGLRAQIKSWLKAGILDADTFSESELGTPQGGVLSPLLANIALHGLEDHLKKWISDKPIKSRTGAKIKPVRRAMSIHVIRYADDFVVMHSDKDIILGAKDEVQKFLSTVGLELSASKTRLTHTLKLNPDDTVEQGFDGKVGFNFLGFTFKQFETRHRSAKATTGELLGYKTLVFPSEKSVNKYQEKLHNLVLQQGKQLNQIALIKKLNPLIRGWASYFGTSDANTTGHLVKQDYLLYLKLRKWARRVTGTSGKGSRFWSRAGNNKWTFMKDSVILLNHESYSNPITSYVKVKGENSPFDGNDSYWGKRMLNYPGLSARVKLLLKRQNGYCKWCRSPFEFGDGWEVDHIIPLTAGGRDELKNLQLLHRHCHDRKTAQDRLKKSVETPHVAAHVSSAR